MEVITVGMTAEQAQFLETRKFQRNEIAAIFGVPPHKIGDLERATFSNIEHQAIEVVTDTIRPWAVAWEQAMTRDLFTEELRRTHMLAFNLDGLLRGDIESRYRAYATGRQWGWLSANDVREREDMNRIADGDLYLAPLNMVPADKIPIAGDTVAPKRKKANAA
jgi:HK97 family phage portal protein